MEGKNDLDLKDLEASEEASQDYLRIIKEEAEEEEIFDWF